MILIPVVPLCVQKAGATAVSRGGACRLGTFDVPIYPPSERGERLRRERLDAGQTMGELARRLGIRASQVSGLEHGQITTDAAWWSECFRAAGAVDVGDPARSEP